MLNILPRNILVAMFFTVCDFPSYTCIIYVQQGAVSIRNISNYTGSDYRLYCTQFHPTVRLID